MSKCLSCGSTNVQLSSDSTRFICMVCNETFQSQQTLVTNEQDFIPMTVQQLIQINIVNQIDRDQNIKEVKRVIKPKKPHLKGLQKQALELLPQVKILIEKIFTLNDNNNPFLTKIYANSFSRLKLTKVIENLTQKIISGGITNTQKYFKYLPKTLQLPKFQIKEKSFNQLTPELLLAFELQIFPSTLYVLQNYQVRVKFQPQFLISLLKVQQLHITHYNQHQYEICYILQQKIIHQFADEFLLEIIEIFSFYKFNKKQLCVYDLYLGIGEPSILLTTCVYFVLSVLVFFIQGGSISKIHVKQELQQELYFSVFLEQNQNVQSLISQQFSHENQKSVDSFVFPRKLKGLAQIEIGDVVLFLQKIDQQRQYNLFLIIELLSKHVSNKFSFEYFLDKLSIIQ